MPKTLLICKSTTGFTRRYADIIAADIGCEIMDYRRALSGPLPECDAVIFGSRLFAGKIDGLDKIRPLISRTGAKFIIFATGATPNAAADVINAMWRSNLSAEELSALPHFYMQAGMALDKLPFAERMMMKIATMIMARKKAKSDEEQGFADAISRSFDIADAAYARPLIEYMQSEVLK